MPHLDLPDPSLVLLVGASGSGKSRFAHQRFGRFETLSSDAFRGLVANDDTDQSATPDAFDALRFVAARRLTRGLLTVVDATSVRRDARRRLLDFAEAHAVPAVAIVFDLPVGICVSRARSRPDRPVPDEVVRSQHRTLQEGLADLADEGFHSIHVLKTDADVAAVTVSRIAMRTAAPFPSSELPEGRS